MDIHAIDEVEKYVVVLSILVLVIIVGTDALMLTLGIQTARRRISVACVLVKKH